MRSTDGWIGDKDMQTEKQPVLIRDLLQRLSEFITLLYIKRQKRDVLHS